MTKKKEQPELKRTGRNISGALPDKNTERDKQLISLRMMGSRIGLPTTFSAVSWDEFLGPIKDQGISGACTSFASVCALEAMIKKVRNKVVDLSEEMAYLMARYNDEWPGVEYEGSSVKGALKGMNKHGVCREELWPYDDKSESLPASPVYLADALLHKTTSYLRISPPRGKITPTAVIAGLFVSPVVVAMFLPAGFEYTDKSGTVKDGPLNTEGGHAMCIVGYDPEKKLFKIRNSWGDRWGKSGYCFMTGDQISKYTFSAWVIKLSK